MTEAIKFDQLEDLPSLREEWVRLVHRCIAGDGRRVENIRKNGLIFNRKGAELSPNEIGGSYNSITAMASVYNEDEFWLSMKKDDFTGFNDARYADTKLIFDIPIKEFAFLQCYGQFIKGKVDAKYLVGCIKNYNGANPKFIMPTDDIEKAQKISQANSPSNVATNKISDLFSDLKKKYPRVDENEVVKDVENYIEDFIFVNKNIPQKQIAGNLTKRYSPSKDI